MNRYRENSKNGKKTATYEDKDSTLVLKTDEGEVEMNLASDLADNQHQNSANTASQSLPHSRKIPKSVIRAVAGIAVVGTTIFGYQYWHYTSTHEETDNATVSGHIHQISSRVNGTISEIKVNDNQLVQKGQLFIKLDPRDLEVKVLQAQASLESAKRQALAAQSNISLAAETSSGKTNQAQGDVMAAVANIDNLKAAVAEAQAGIPAAQAAVKEAEAGISSAIAQVAQADASLQKAQTDYKRYLTLERLGAVARQQLDTAKATYEVDLAQKNVAIQGVEQAKAKLAIEQQEVAKAQSHVAQAQQNVVNAQAKLMTSKGAFQQAVASGKQTEVNRAQYQANKAEIAQAEASLKDAQLQLSYTNIVAPSSGIVGHKTIEVGQRVQPGSALMSIVESDYWITANFKETQLKDIKPGQKVKIKLDTFGNHTFIGRVDSVSPASGAEFALLPPDNATGNFTKIVQRIPVKITFDLKSIKGYESLITPGMSAVVSVEHN